MTWSKGERLKEREPTVMMKKALILLLIFVFCLSSAYAEDNVWVEESWRQIDREVDCDEIPLKSRKFRKGWRFAGTFWIIRAMIS